MADDVTIRKGTGGRVFWPLFDANDLPVNDFTGWTAAAQVRTHSAVVADDPATDVNESNLLHTFTYEFADSGIYLSYTAAETAAWKFSRGVGDVFVTSPDEEPVRPIRFYLWVSPRVSEL